MALAIGIILVLAGVAIFSYGVLSPLLYPDYGLIAALLVGGGIATIVWCTFIC